MNRADYPKCATCSHWRRPEWAEESQCHHPDHEAIGTADRAMKPSAARPEDASSYAATLITGPEFGCVNHSAGGV